MDVKRGHGSFITFEFGSPHVVSLAVVVATMLAVAGCGDTRRKPSGAPTSAEPTPGLPAHLPAVGRCTDVYTDRGYFEIVPCDYAGAKARIVSRSRSLGRDCGAGILSSGTAVFCLKRLPRR